MTDDLVKRLFDRLGSISTSRMEGDNLAILLCGVFDNPDQEIDDEYGWTPDAVLGCDEVLDAIKAHFQPFADRIEALTAEIERLREALTDIGVYGCGMLNQPAAMNGPEEAWLRLRIREMENVARAALGNTQ